MPPSRIGTEDRMDSAKAASQSVSQHVFPAVARQRWLAGIRSALLLGRLCRINVSFGRIEHRTSSITNRMQKVNNKKLFDDLTLLYRGLFRGRSPNGPNQVSTVLTLGLWSSRTIGQNVASGRKCSRYACVEFNNARDTCDQMPIEFWQEWNYRRRWPPVRQPPGQYQSALNRRLCPGLI